MSERYELEGRVALAAVREASRLCQAVQSRLEPELSMEKPDESPVTVADFGAQALICRRLHESFPADPVIGEETADALRSDDGLRHKVLDEVSLTLGDPSDPVDVLAWIDRGGSRDYAPRYWDPGPDRRDQGVLAGSQLRHRPGADRRGAGRSGRPCRPEPLDHGRESRDWGRLPRDPRRRRPLLSAGGTHCPGRRRDRNAAHGLAGL